MRPAARGEMSPSPKRPERSCQLAPPPAFARGNLPLQTSQSRPSRTHNSLHWGVVVFLVGLAVPWTIPLGALNLNVYRLVLLAFLLPCLWNWVRGTLGRISLPEA